MKNRARDSGKVKKTTDFKRSMIKKGDYYNLLINECNNLLFIDENSIHDSINSQMMVYQRDCHISSNFKC